MKHLISAILLAGLLPGHAMATTTYENGIKDHRIEDNLYEVVFKGDASTTPTRVNLLWVFRCAEIAKQQGKAYVSLDEASGKEIVKPYEFKSRQPGFGSQSWAGGALPLTSGVLRPSDSASYLPLGGHPVIIHNFAAPGQNTFVHDGLARLFDDPPPIEAGVTFKAQVLFDALTDYAHGDPQATPPILQSIFSSARVVTPLGKEYAEAQTGLRTIATTPTPGDPKSTNIGVALLHENMAFPGQGSWLPEGESYLAEGSVVKSDGKSVTFIAALPLADSHFRFERLHVDCGRGTGGVVVGYSVGGQNDVTSAQLAAIADTETTLSSLDAVHRPLADAACIAAGYTLQS